MARWKKWILFFVAFLIIFAVFTLLEGLKLIQGGRWMWMTGTYLILYYYIFVKKPKMKIKMNVVDEVKYDFKKMNDKK